MTPAEIIEVLGLAPLPGEGGYWAQVLRDPDSTAIYYLVTVEEFSALHRLPGPEVYHHYLGDPLELTLIAPDGRLHRPVVGTDLVAGQRPAAVVAGGTWQGARTLGDWSLVGTTMAPPYRDDDVELADRSALVDAFPDHAEIIGRLTR